MILPIALVASFLAFRYLGQAKTNLFFSVVTFRIFSINLTRMEIEIDLMVNNATRNTYTLRNSYLVLKYPVSESVNTSIGTFIIRDGFQIPPMAETKVTIKGSLPILSLINLLKEYITTKNKMPFEVVGTIKADNLPTYTGKVFEDDFRTYLDTAKSSLAGVLSFLGLSKKK